MSRLSDLHHRLVQRLCDADPRLAPESILEHVLLEVDWSLETHNDAVCLVIARSILGGVIVELTPGCWMNLHSSDDGVRARDLCGAQARSGGGGWKNGCSRFEPDEFLARDTTGTLAARASALEHELAAHIAHQLAT